MIPCRTFAFAALPLALFLGAAAASDLDRVAKAAAEQAHVAAPLRADVKAEIDGLEGKKSERIVMLFRPAPSGPGIETYVQLGEGALRYLVQSDGTAWVAEGGKARKIPLDTLIGATSWTVEELLPFSIERCGLPRTVEVMPAYMTVLCDPKQEHRGQYVLWVYKFDREKAMPERVLFYQERQDNLVKMLRNEDFTLIGRKWRPKRMVMQNFKLRTRDVFEIEWSQDPKFPPEIFDPGTFAGASLPPARASG
jgi:hypothetical protein